MKNKSTNKKIEEISEDREEELLDTWNEVEDMLKAALDRTVKYMLEDPDDNLLLKLSAVSLFVSRFQYLFHEKMKGIENDDDE
jgi:hypothetical protein